MGFPLAAIGIIGLGQVGASVAFAAKQHQLAERVLGVDRNTDYLRFCLDNGAIDQSVSLIDAAQQSDLLILAVPPEAIGAVAMQLLPHLKPGAVLTDVASTKQHVVEFMQRELPVGISFIPGHPIAGGTRTGPFDARGDIFHRKMVMLTPPLGIDIHDRGLQLTKTFWEKLGSVVELMPADFHDLVYAHVSHLPHLMAYAASATLVDESLENAPDGFFRFIRLGLSGPALWTDIFLQNQQYVLQALQMYLAMLGHIREELESGAEPSDQIDPQAGTVLFPRIAASTLIATVTMVERQSGQKLARYSGAGFADVASPAAEAPDADLERISKSYKQVAALLLRYQRHLEALAAAIEGGQRSLLLRQLEQMHEANIALRQRLGAAV